MFKPGQRVMSAKGNKETGPFRGTVVCEKRTPTVGRIVVLQKRDGTKVWCRPQNLKSVSK